MSSSFLVANHTAGDERLLLRVDPDAGPTRNYQIPGNASTYTAVLNAGLHVRAPSRTGWATPPRRASPSRLRRGRIDVNGWTETDAAGHYDLYLDPGSYTFDVYSATSPALSSYWLYRPHRRLHGSVARPRARDRHPDRPRPHAGWPARAVERAAELLGHADGSVADRLAEHLQLVAVTGADVDAARHRDKEGAAPSIWIPTWGSPPTTNLSITSGDDEVTVQVDPGITITGQVTVPGIAPSRATRSPCGPRPRATWHRHVGVRRVLHAHRGPTGPGRISVDVFDATVGSFYFQRQMTLSGGENIPLAPDLDYLELYLLGRPVIPAPAQQLSAAAATTAT